MTENSKKCVCGEPWAKSTIHRTDGPCYATGNSNTPTPTDCDCETLAGMKAHTMECVFGHTPTPTECQCNCHVTGFKVCIRCTCHKQPTETWREEFDRIYQRKNEWHPDASPVDVKAFIAQKIAKAREEGQLAEVFPSYTKGFREGAQAERGRILKLIESLWDNGVTSFNMRTIRHAITGENETTPPKV